MEQATNEEPELGRLRQSSLFALLVASIVLGVLLFVDYQEAKHQQDALYDLVFSRAAQTSLPWSASDADGVEYGNRGTASCPSTFNMAHSRLHAEIIRAMPTWTPNLERVCVTSMLLPGAPARSLRVSVRAHYHGLVPLPGGFTVSVTVNVPA